MKTKPKSAQMELFKTPLSKIINNKHELCILSIKIE